MEINTWIHKVLAHGADLNPGAGPVPLREGVDKTRVSQLESVFWPFAQFYPLTTLIFSRRVLRMLTARHGGSPCPRTWQNGK
jgi:hypothetical protein